MADQQDTVEKQLRLEHMYLKDVSFESPKTPEVFTSNIDTEIQLNVNSTSRQIDSQRVEVTLTLKVQSLAQEAVVFSIELAQAGIFAISGYTPDERFAMLATVCPDTLYPFAREAVADVATKGGFPQLLLQPLAFNELFAREMQNRAAQATPAPAPTQSVPGGGETN